MPKILNAQDDPSLVLLVETNKGSKAIVVEEGDTPESIQTWIEGSLSKYLQVTDQIGWFQPAAAPKAKKGKASKPATPKETPTPPAGTTPESTPAPAPEDVI